MRRTAFLLVLCGLVAAQPAARMEFDAASIKLHPPAGGPLRVSMAGEHGHINYENVTIRALIRKAYGTSRVFPLSTGQLDPYSIDRYDIIAKGAGEASDEQTRQMLQSLLEDRFKLKIHREMKELPVYALIAGKGGPKFHEVKDDGSAVEINGGGEGHPIVAHHISMKMLAATLSGYVGDPVQDMTGLTGMYDLKLEFTSDQNPDAAGPSVFTAVQEQLGLKLEARKAPLEVLVIDRAEKPSEN